MHYGKDYVHTGLLHGIRCILRRRPVIVYFLKLAVLYSNSIVCVTVDPYLLINFLINLF